MKIKNDVTPKQKEDFFDGFMAQLSKYPLGSMPKRDLDCLIYHLLEKHNFLIGDNNLEISNNLGISLRKLNSFILDSNVKFTEEHNYKENAKKVLNKLLKNQKVNFENDLFIFAEENPILREDFVQAMKDEGYFTDTSHNKEIIKVKAVAIFDFITKEKIDKDLIKMLLDSSNVEEEKLQAYIDENKSWKDVFKDLGKKFFESEGNMKTVLFQLIAKNI